MESVKLDEIVSLKRAISLMYSMAGFVVITIYCLSVYLDKTEGVVATAFGFLMAIVLIAWRVISFHNKIKKELDSN